MGVNYSNLTKHIQKLEKKLSKQACKEFMEQATNEVTVNLERLIIKATPVLSSNLAGSWTATPAKLEGNICKSEISNPTEYAIYVEYGHRQEVGRYVPAIGKRLTKAWADGVFFMTDTVEQFKPVMPQMVGRMVDEFLEGFNG